MRFRGPGPLVLSWAMRRLFLISAVLTVLCTQSIACDVIPETRTYIAEVLSPVTFTLSDGRTLRLEGLGPPRAPSRHDGPWPFLEEATDRTRTLMGEGGGAGALRFSATDAPDRYGRVIAQAFLEDGTWLNGALAERGLARVETTWDQRRCAGEALALEAEARTGARGLWRLSAYEVRNPLEAGAFTNDFQIIEGRIAAADEVRGRLYLNFGADWRTDFTVTIAPSHARRFAEAGLDPLSWAGRKVRVRGWLEWFNGPMIEASHPEQIELFGGAREDDSNEENL